MSKENIKKHMVEHANFLKAIIRSNEISNTKLLLKSATTDELAALAYVLAGIAQGFIPMKSAAHKNLKQRRKLAQFRHRFESSEDLKDFLNLTHYEKETTLTTFAPSLPYLLRPLVTPKHS